ncbi:MAG: tryptophan--tRNA ligase [Myxococcales bacterium]|nr:MAG: tryptophan--tRNA ligase [Myxococcales bacterium]
MRILSGIQPSNKIHIGNYFGALKQFVDLQNEPGEALFFIADHHALTTVHDGPRLDQLSVDVALDYLACGLDPERCTLFRQSDIPEVTELFWYLLTVTPMGLLEKAVSYKDKVARGFPAEAGLFTYPVLMAADILAYGSDLVPVGRDQQQHLEIARDIAIKFNLRYVPKYDPSQPDGDKKGRGRGLLRLPQARVIESTAVVPGTDNQKMSKSYGNVIEVFADDATVKKQIMGLKTDSASVEDPKDPAATPILPLLRLFAPADEIAEHERTFAAGGLGYGHYKARLLELFHATFGEARARRRDLANNRDHVEQVLRDGARKARAHAAPVLDGVRRAVGTAGALHAKAPTP